MSELTLPKAQAIEERLPEDSKARELAVDVRRSFVVSAPAGSGKTGLLTLRVLKLLACVQQPEEILAITFTRKAAREMHERITSVLQQSRKLAPNSEAFAELDPYSKTLVSAGHAALARSQALSWDLLDNSQRLNISTIDGFCKSLCNALPFFSGLGAGAGIVDTPALVYMQAVESWLEAELKNEEHKNLSLLLSHFGGRVDRIAQLCAQLLAMREQWLPLVIAARQEQANLRQRFESVIQLWVERAIAQAATALASYEGDLLNLIRYAVSNKDEAKDASMLEALAEHLDAFPLGEHSVQWWQAFARFCLSGVGTANVAFRKRLDKNLGFPTGQGKEEKQLAKEKKEALKAIFAELLELDAVLDKLALIPKLPPARYSDEQWQLLDALLQVLPELAAELKLHFVAQAKTDFSEISIGAVTALNAQIGSMDLLQRLDYSLQHILIDEFQDTSQLQLELLMALTQEWSRDDGRSLFLVGDGMQSCYAFRNANVGIFLNMREHGLENIDIQALDLNVNFRSTPVVVNWVNDVFSYCFPDKNDTELGAVAYIPSQAFKLEDTNAAVTCVAHVDAEGSAEQEADYIVGQIQKLRLEAPDDSIAVLAKSRSHLEVLIAALRNEAVPYQAHEIDALASKRHVQDVLIIARLLVNPADELAWLALLRSPWCALGHEALSCVFSARPNECLPSSLLRKRMVLLAERDADAVQRLSAVLDVLEPLTQTNHLRSLSENVERAWLQLGGASLLLDEAQSQDVDTLLTLIAAHEDASTIRDWPAFSDALTRLYAAVPQSEHNPVQLMTMHKSKGLEFDAVFLPNLQKRGRGEDSEALYWMERLNDRRQTDFVLSPIATYDADDKVALTEFIKSQRKQQKRYEDQRVFYVACTRAKKRLYLSAQLKQAEDGQWLPPSSSSLLHAGWQTLQHEFRPAPEHIKAAALKEEQVSTLSSRFIYALAPSWKQEFEQRFKEAKAESPEPGFDNSQLDIHELWREHRSEESRAGTVLHQVLAQLCLRPDSAWHDFATRPESWLHLFRQQGIHASKAAPWINQFTRCVLKLQSEPQARWLLSPDYVLSKCEWPLTYLDARQRRKNVVLDRCFIDEQNCLWIVDYKSSSPKKGQNIDSFFDSRDGCVPSSVAGLF